MFIVDMTRFKTLPVVQYEADCVKYSAEGAHTVLIVRASAADNSWTADYCRRSDNRRVAVNGNPDRIGEMEFLFSQIANDETSFDFYATKITELAKPTFLPPTSVGGKRRREVWVDADNYGRRCGN